MAIHIRNNGDFFELFLDYGTVQCSRTVLCHEDAVDLYSMLQKEVGSVLVRDETEDKRMVNMDKSDRILSTAQFKHDILKNAITDDTMPTNEIHVIGTGGKKVIIKF